MRSNTYQNIKIMFETNRHFTEIRIDLERVFEAACRRTLEAVKAVAGASPEAALSADELPWARDRMREARDRVARLLDRMAKGITELPQAEQEDEELVFRVVCRTPIQEGLLKEAVGRYLTNWVAAAWLRLHPELGAAIDMERETDELNHLTLMCGRVKRPSQVY